MENEFCIVHYVACRLSSIKIDFTDYPKSLISRIMKFMFFQ